MNKCVQYEVSMTIYVGSIPHQRKLPKMAAILTTIGQNYYTFNVHM